MRGIKCPLIALSVLLALAAPAFAGRRTVTLMVPGMTCSTCAITLNKALKKISGVEKIDVKLEQRQIVLTYDDARTDVPALVKATTNAGYPSSEKKGEK